MPPDWIIRDICSPACVWHKPGEKEEMSCRGARVIEAFGEGNLPPAFKGEEGSFANFHDELLFELVCRDCPFRPDGCDFRDPEITEPATPCGGYIHLDILLADGMITEERLRSVIESMEGA